MYPTNTYPTPDMQRNSVGMPAKENLTGVLLEARDASNQCNAILDSIGATVLGHPDQPPPSPATASGPVGLAGIAGDLRAAVCLLRQRLNALAETLGAR